MPYVQTEYWKAITKEFPDDVLDMFISRLERSIPEMKELANRGDPDSPIYQTIEIEESDLALYMEEKKRRLAQKK